MSNNDDWDEIDNHGYGSLSGDGVVNHNKVTSKVTKEGVINTIPCDGCQRELSLLAPWSEVIFMSRGQLPLNHSWKHEPRNGCFVPTNPCPRCHNDLRLGVTPDECNKHLKAGVQSGAIQAAQIQAFMQQNRLA